MLDFAADIPPSAASISREIDVNLKGLVNVAGSFLPLLRRHPSAMLINVGSGLGFVPKVLRLGARIAPRFCLGIVNKVRV